MFRCYLMRRRCTPAFRRIIFLVLLLSSATYLVLLYSVSSLSPEDTEDSAEYEVDPSSLPNCSKIFNSEVYPDSIPPLVHWTSKAGRIPAKLIPLVRSWRSLINVTVNGSQSSAIFAENQQSRGNSKNLQPDSISNNCTSENNTSEEFIFYPDRWHFMHWDDKQITELISKHYPRLATAYNKLINGLERSDIGRLVILHHVGGLYVDTDVELLRDPTPLLRPSQLQGVGMSPNFSCDHAVWSQELPEHAAFPLNRPSLMSNAVMLSRANHSFLSFVLNNWPQWFEKNWAKKKWRESTDAVRVTGPVMLQSFYEKYTALHQSDRPEDWCGNMLADADTFQPIRDVVYAPERLEAACARPEKLSELQRQFCNPSTMLNLSLKKIPNSSYTVHRYMHLSYREINMAGSQPISSLIPIFRCKV